MLFITRHNSPLRPDFKFSGCNPWTHEQVPLYQRGIKHTVF